MSLYLPFATRIAPIMFAGKSANVEEKKMSWWKQGGRSSSSLFRFHCLNRKLSRAAQGTSANLCSWELMRKALSQLLSPFWLSILSYVLHVNCLITNNWIYIPSCLENTNWVVPWRKVFELLNCFWNSYSEGLYTKKMRRKCLQHSHHWEMLYVIA